MKPGFASTAPTVSGRATLTVDELEARAVLEELRARSARGRSAFAVRDEKRILVYAVCGNRRPGPRLQPWFGVPSVPCLNGRRGDQAPGRRWR